MKTRYIILLLILVGFAGCELVVDVDIPQRPPVLVVNSLFSTDKNWNARVSLSKEVLEESYEFPVVLDATVTIRDMETNAVEVLIGDLSSNPGYYHSTSAPEPGKQYRITVEAPGRTTVQAEGAIPVAVPIVHVEIDSTNINDYEKKVPVKITFNDPGGAANFYQLNLNTLLRYEGTDYVNDTYFELDNPALQSISDNYGSLIIDDKLFNGKTYTISCRVNAHYFASNGTDDTPFFFQVVLSSLSKEYYEYVTTLRLQSAAEGDPFAQPALVFTNIENGLGIFAGYTKSIVEYPSEN